MLSNLGTLNNRNENKRIFKEKARIAKGILEKDGIPTDLEVAPVWVGRKGTA